MVGCGTAEVMIKRKLTSVEKANQEALPLRSLLSSRADVGVDRLRADLLTPVCHASRRKRESLEGRPYILKGTTLTLSDGLSWDLQTC